MFFRDGTLVYQRDNNDQRARLRPPDRRDRSARARWRHAYGGGPAVADARRARAGLPAPQLHPARLAHLRQRAHRLERPLPPSTSTAASVRPLTRGYRAHEPDVSPDGTQVACVVARRARAPARAGPDRRRRAARARARRRPASPTRRRFRPTAALIAYSRWKPGGFRDIHLYDLGAGTDRALTVDRAMDVDPRFTPDGRYLLLASDRTGIYDVYAYELATGAALSGDQRARPARSSPSVSTDGSQLVYSGFTIDGFDLYAMPFDPKSFRLAQPFANARADASRQTWTATAIRPTSVGAAPAGAADDHADDQLQALEVHVPAKLELSFYSDALGLGRAGCVSTTHRRSGRQPPRAPRTCCSRWTATVGRGRLLATRGCSRRSTSTFRRTAQRVPGLIVDGVDTLYRQHVLGASASTRMTYPADAVVVGRAVVRLRLHAPTRPPTRFPSRIRRAASSIRPEVGPDADLFLWWYFYNAHAWRYSISTQEGRLRQIRPPLLGSGPRGAIPARPSSAGSWQEYLTPPWARLHALALLWAGGIGIGDKRAVLRPGRLLRSRTCCARSFSTNRSAARSCAAIPPNSFVGDSYQIVSAEYRAPLLRIERGYQTFPPTSASCGAPPSSTRATRTRAASRPSQIEYDVGAEAEPRPQPRLLPRNPDQDRLRPRFLRAGRRPVVLPRRRVLLSDRGLRFC